MPKSDPAGVSTVRAAAKFTHNPRMLISPLSGKLVRLSRRQLTREQLRRAAVDQVPQKNARMCQVVRFVQTPPQDFVWKREKKFCSFPQDLSAILNMVS
jgi:hypothetical protein